MMNVQLKQSERSQVYIDTQTKRILGFGPEGAEPSLTSEQKKHLSVEICYHVADIERYMKKFREQSLHDEEEASLRKLERERPIRKALRDAIVERNGHVSPWNQAVNNALIKSMDYYYEQSVSARQRAEVAMMAERYDAGKSTEDIVASVTPKGEK
jgi:hypothetical protein